MRTMGFVISGKENEDRRALLPRDVSKIKNSGMLFFEKGYGEVLGISDQAYERSGAKVCSRAEAYTHSIICNPKTPTTSEQEYYSDGQTLFGWIHAVQGREIVDFFLSKSMSGIAWEDMFENDRHTFWRNNEISGEAAVLHAVRFMGRLPEECKVAVIGRGNCARGACKMLSRLGAEIIVYDRRTVKNLRKEIGQFDIVVNAVLWDVFRTDHLVYREDLRKMVPGSMIIDISCDEAMGIETSHPTTIEDPVYLLDGVIHYAVDHTPALFAKSATDAISRALYPFIDSLVEEQPNEVLEKATCIKEGVICDDRINRFQNRKPVRYLEMEKEARMF